MKITSITKVPLIKSPIVKPELSKRNVKVAMGRIVVAKVQEYDYKGYHIRIEEDSEQNENLKKWFYVSKDGIEVDAGIGPYEPDNTVSLWIDANCPSNPHNNWTKTKLIEYIKERDQHYQNSFAKTKQIIKIAEHFKKIPHKKKLEAQNSVNMGAEVNNGMQTAPVSPTDAQEQQIEQNYIQDPQPMDQNLTPQKHNKSIMPAEKRQLMQSINTLKRTFPELAQGLKSPQAKQYLTMFLSQMANNPYGKANGIPLMLQRIHNMSDKDLQNL